MDLYGYQKSERRLTQRQVKLLFMEQDPHCFWCGIEVREYILRRGQHSPHDLATVDHLFDRLEPDKRYRNWESNINKVLACYSCNHQRALFKERILGKEFNKKRSELGRVRIPTTPRPIYFKELNESIDK